jgi:hypothetical protein|tara:strand:+ start:11602 stop:11829 length:228 start_codon:yes stop_codon:yes gene_type:complete
MTGQMPDMKCMYVNVWVHHMQLDELFDFLTDRIEEAPDYWLNESSSPFSVSGGYIMVTLPYDSYSNLRSHKDWSR